MKTDINASGYAHNKLFGSADEKYQCQGDVPHSELLFKAVLKYNTAPSGHTSRPQNHESTSVDVAIVSNATTDPSPTARGAEINPLASMCNPIGASNKTTSHRSKNVATVI
jgi:hypothetical protein